MKRRTPYEWQIRARDFLASKGQGALWMEPRTGKTLSSLLGVRALGVRKPLILTVNPVKYQWAEEAELEEYECDILEGRKRKWPLGSRGLVANYESVWRGEVNPAHFDALVFDESIRLQNPRSKGVAWWMERKACRELPDVRFLLSGAPCPESELQAMPQLWIAGHDLGGYRTYWHYLQANWHYDERGYKWRPIGDARKTAKRMIDEFGFAVTQESIGFGVTKAYSVIKVKASKAENALYDRICDAGKYVNADGEKADVTDTLRGQMLQIASMGVDPLDLSRKEVIGHSKVKALAEWVQMKSEEEPDACFVIFCRHIMAIDMVVAQLAALKREAPVYRIDGRVANETRHGIVAEFSKGRSAALVIQCDIGKMGLNLSVANYILYFEDSWSGDTRIQSEERCTVAGKTAIVEIINFCTVFHDGYSADLRIAEAVQSKRDANAELLLRGVRKWRESSQ